ncbi:MAG: HD domain-containing protein [bacterium]
MKTKNSLPTSLLKKQTDPNIQLYLQFNKLKLLYRQGWLRFVPESKCESVAEHTLGVILLGLLFKDKLASDLDICKYMKMSLIHDFGEIIIGDLKTTIENENPDDKYNREKSAIKDLFKNIADGEEFINLWTEIEEGQTAEAIFVKQMDKIEMILQASIYENTYQQKMQEFYDYTRTKYGETSLKYLIEEIESLRPEL